MSTSNIKINVKKDDSFEGKFPQTNSEQVILLEYGDLDTYLKQTTAFRVINDELVYRDPTTGANKKISNTLSTQPLKNVSNLTVESLTTMANIKWEDPENILVADEAITTWAGTRVVIKEGAPPSTITDGFLVHESTTRNQYMSEGLDIPNLEVNTVYYVKLFPFTTEGVFTNDDSNSIIIDTTAEGLDPITDILVETAGSAFAIRLTDPEDKVGVYKGQTYNIAEYAGTKVVIKKDSKPTSHQDGIVAYSYATRNDHNTVEHPLYFNVPSEGLWYVTVFNYTKDFIYSVAHESNHNIIFTQLGAPSLFTASFNINFQPNIRWKDPVDVVTSFNSLGKVTTTWQKSKLVRKEGSEPANENDGVLIVETNTRDKYGGRTGYIDETVTGEGTEYYYKLFSMTNENKASGSTAIVMKLPDDQTRSPGSNYLVAGNRDVGYYGETTFIGATALINLIGGLPEGINISSAESSGWLKFTFNGKILFVAKQPIKHSISPNALWAKGLTDGSKIIYNSGYFYKVRILKGVIDGGSSHTDAIGSEWNQLMLPIHEEAPDQWKIDGLPYNEFAGVTDDWNINLTNVNMGVGNGLGTITRSKSIMGLETYFLRGKQGVSDFTSISSSTSTADCGWRPVLEFIGESLHDYTGAPGQTVTVMRVEKDGYFGEVVDGIFISGDQLASQLGLTVGISQNSTGGWLKFTSNGKIIFVAKKTFRFGLTRSDLEALNIIDGSKIITINGVQYRVRLLKGLADDGTSLDDAKGSEWNRLILPLHIKVRDRTWNSTQYVDDYTPNWDRGFTDAELFTDNSTGGATLCQEVIGTDNQPVYRGSSDASFASSSSTGTMIGWRPVLEVV